MLKASTLYKLTINSGQIPWTNLYKIIFTTFQMGRDVFIKNDECVKKGVIWWIKLSNANNDIL
jgi:hypothetical protein